MKVKSEREVAQSCPTLCDPMNCSLPGSSIHGIFQARVLEWGAIAFMPLASANWEMSEVRIFTPLVFFCEVVSSWLCPWTKDHSSLDSLPYMILLIDSGTLPMLIPSGP